MTVTTTWTSFRGCLPAVVAESTRVSPSCAVAEPAAWRARRPVENRISRDGYAPLSMTATDSWTGWSDMTDVLLCSGPDHDCPAERFRCRSSREPPDGSLPERHRDPGGSGPPTGDP